MARSIRFILCVLLAVLPLVACSDGNEQELIEKYGNVETESDFIADIDWLEPETEYSYDGEDENIVAIYSELYNRQGDRLYLQTKSGAANTYNYINLKPGEQFILCPDPLCPHTRDSGCQFIDISCIQVSDDENIVYAVKYCFDDEASWNQICELDLVNNTIKPIYGEKSLKRFDIYMPYFIAGRKLYFETRRRNYPEEMIAAGVARDEVFLMELDLDTYEVRTFDNKYAAREYGSCIYADDEYFFFSDSERSRLFVTDRNFDNEQVVYDFPDNYQLTSPYYDNDTDEFYCVIYSKFMTKLSDDGVTEGYILRVDGDLNVERLDLRSDLILDMQLTRDYIYYTSYDPIEYGISPRGGVCYDESGGKIWRVPRDDVLAEPELIFDGRGEFAFLGYYAVGDCLYLDYSEIVQENGIGYFRWHGINARVNFVDGTIKWLT